MKRITIILALTSLLTFGCTMSPAFAGEAPTLPASCDAKPVDGSGPTTEEIKVAKGSATFAPPIDIYTVNRECFDAIFGAGKPFVWVDTRRILFLPHDWRSMDGENGSQLLLVAFQMIQSLQTDIIEA